MSDFLTAARYTDRDVRLPHQDAAWHWAWQRFSDSERQRFLEMFRAAPTLNPPDVTPVWVPVATYFIKRWEGVRLSAYHDAVNVVTIGFGTTRYPKTGKAVQMGDQITMTEAEAFLRHDISTLYGPKVLELVPAATGWSANRIAALISFAYNCGVFALKNSTLRSRLNKGEDPDLVVAEELPKWNKADGRELEGLTRRRAAEVALFLKDGDPPALITSKRENPLPVPWFSQRDSATSEGARMCFSSSCAMLVAYLRPGALEGANGDDQYLHRLHQYGDTTDAAAQVRTLSSFGVKAKFVQNADFTTIESQIVKGVPVPCGYLHRGPLTKPTGGHWLIVVGYDATHLIVHDPYGEADLVGGTTLPRPARFCRYSRANFGQRWMAEGRGSGWAIIAEP